MKKNVSIITRIPREARLALLQSAEGMVNETVLGVLLPIWAFESFTKGKNPVFAIEGIKRICGCDPYRAQVHNPDLTISICGEGGRTGRRRAGQLEIARDDSVGGVLTDLVTGNSPC